jgi:hypothetical protein
MKIECTDKKTFQLTDDGQKLGQLIYKSLFSYDAEIVMPDLERFKIKPAGFFGTSIEVTKSGMKIANLQMNWKGQIVIDFLRGEEFIFKAKGAFHNNYIIENKEGERLIQFDPKFNWSKFHYSYNISFEKKPQDILFILLGVYASNYYIAVMSGGGTV